MPLDAHDACPATIYEARTLYPIESRLTVRGVVTAARSAGNFAIQVPVDDPAWAGTANSGLWVFIGNATPPVEASPPFGAHVRITGVTNDFFGQRQLHRVLALEILDEPASVPDALAVAPDDIATGGPRAEELEGVLVTVEDVEVTDVAPAPGMGDRAPTHEFVVGGSLRVDDFFFRPDPPPIVGSRFSRIAGVLRFSNEHSKLEPRNADDLVRGAPALAAFGPDRTSIQLGGAGVPVTAGGEPLTVRLDHAARVDVDVELGSDDAEVRVPDRVTIPAGEIEAPVRITAALAAGDVVLTARLGGRVLTTTVVVRDAGAVRGLLVLNELDYDQEATDFAEFLEIRNPADRGVALGGLSVELVNGNDGMVYDRYALGDAGDVLPARGYLVIASEMAAARVPGGALVLPTMGNRNVIQNGEPDGIRIVDDTGIVVDSVSYGRGLMAGITEGDAPAPSDRDMGDFSIGRCGRDTDQNAVDFLLLERATPGADNACP